jgi:hypothetical protein
MGVAFDTVSFQEIQRFRQPSLWGLLGTLAFVVIGVMACGLLVQLILGRPWGKNPVPDGVLVLIAGFAILTVAGVVWLMYAAHFITEVRSSGLYVKFYPFHRSFQQIDLNNVINIEVVTYRPLRDYGGYGIRYGIGGKAYNVYGNRGVKLTYREGKTLMIGSQRPEEFAGALEPRLRR